MALNKYQRLAPPLMYAFRVAHEKRDGDKTLDLRDAGGERVIAPRRAPNRAPITEGGLRREVNADLADLLNTTHLGAAVDLTDAPEVARSILNFGFPDLSSYTIDDQRMADISRQIEQALATFEPRLARDSLKVARDAEVDLESLRIKFFIKADLRAEPIAVAVDFVAEIEMDSGKIKVERL